VLTGPTRPQPGGALLVYDADCGFCTRAVQWAVRVVEPAVRPVPSYALDLAAHGLTQERVDREMVLLPPYGASRGGAMAAAGVLRRARGRHAVAWRALGRVLAVPPVRWAAALVYRTVAHNRHRLPGATDACRLPSPPQADRTSENHIRPTRSPS
jgi:predicted DCC family thiol-disulfide oxidoreductase YuxK